jgi:hypothetical protein
VVSALPGLNLGAALSPTQSLARLAQGWRIVELASMGYVRHGAYHQPKRIVYRTYWCDPKGNIFVPASGTPKLRWVRIAQRSL